VRPSAGGRVLPNPRFSGAAKKASCDRQLAHFRPVFTRIPADPLNLVSRQGEFRETRH